jgi:cardiolipin synthase A/B
MLIMAIVYVANLILFMIVALNEAKRPIWALPWLVICAILPIIGFISYFLLTKKVSQIARVTRTMNEGLTTRAAQLPEAVESAWPMQTGAGNTDEPLPSGSKPVPIIAASLRKLGFHIQHASVKLMTNGVETFDSLIHALDRAQDSIDVDFYIYRNDDIGNAITNLLIQKARSGVKVRYIRDAIGSHAYPKSEVNRMLAAGIECKVFHPVRFPWLRPSLNQRDHGKIVIIDHVEAFIGGVNVGNEYTGQDPLKGPWRDTEMHMISDELEPLVECFETNWRQATPERRKPFRSEMKTNGTEDIDGMSAITGVNPKEKANASRSGSFGNFPLPLMRFEAASELHPDIDVTGQSRILEDNLDTRSGRTSDSNEGQASDPKNGRASAKEQYLSTIMQTVYGNPDIRTDAMRELFFLCVAEARSSVDITTPYFAPDVDLVMALKVAAHRNVRVRLLVPRNPDHKLIGLASRTYYPELLLAGVEIYLHEKGILHAKTMIIDNHASVVGATNFDLRSFHLNREVCEVMYSPEVAKLLGTQFERDLLDASRMTLADTASSIVEQIKELGARLFVPFL